MNHKTKIQIATAFFFVISVLLVLAEYFKVHLMIIVLKPLLIPSLGILYSIESEQTCKWYLLALFFAFVSNVFLLSADSTLLFYGIIAFLFFRLSSIVAVVKNGDPVLRVPVVLATIPFLVMFSYLIYIMVNPEHPSFYATILNAIIISVFCGIGLSSYMMNDNTQNSWLIITTLLSTFLVLVFMFDKFYLSFEIFKPLSAFVFSLAHYAFYKFMIESER